MKYTPAEKKRIYLACKPIFSGANALIRKPKLIREAVDKNAACLKPLFKDFAIHVVADILKILLDNRIFESDIQAKAEFPELFDASPVREVERNASEVTAARNTEEALGKAVADEKEETLMDRKDGPALEKVLEVTKIPVAEKISKVEKVVPGEFSSNHVKT